MYRVIAKLIYKIFIKISIKREFTEAANSNWHFKDKINLN
jgi:hypothetical protein